MTCKILRSIAQQSRLATAPGIWDFLPPVAGVCDLSVATKTMDLLIEQFSSEQLEAAHILVRGSNNQLALNPVLAGHSVRGLLLRRSKDEAPFDIVNQRGALTTGDPPFFACVHDCFTQSYSGESRSVLAAFSDDDLIVSRMLSLPCAPAVGLATMNGEQLRRLFAEPTISRHGMTSQGPAAVPTLCDYQLILTAWNVAALKNELPEGAACVVKHLLKAEDAYGFNATERVRVWQPSARELSRIRSAVEFQDRPLVRTLIGQSVSRSSRSVKRFQAESANPDTTDYGAARRELLRTITKARQLGFQAPEVTKRLEAFNRAFDESVVNAIIRDAMLAPDSVERALLMAASELMGHWHNSSQLVRSTQRSISERRNARDEVMDPDDMKQRLRVVDGLVKIHRELTREK